MGMSNVVDALQTMIEEDSIHTRGRFVISIEMASEICATIADLTRRLEVAEDENVELKAERAKKYAWVLDRWSVAKLITFSQDLLRGYRGIEVRDVHPGMDAHAAVCSLCMALADLEHRLVVREAALKARGEQP